MRGKIGMIRKLGFNLIIFCMGLIAFIFAAVGVGVYSNDKSASAASKSNFGGGTGTLEDPFIVSTVSHFNAITTRLDAYFVQTENIDFSGEKFYPIGDLTHPFTGNYNGQQFLLSGIQVDGGDNLGVFSFVYSGGVVKNVRVNNSVFNGRTSIGAIAGENAGRIEGCYSDTTITAETYAGGIVGNNSGVVSQCVNASSVAANAMFAGGIAGTNTGKISDSYNRGSVTAEYYVGGIVALNNGANGNTQIDCVYNVGELSGNIKGNIAGDNLNGIINKGRFLEGTGIKSVAAFDTGSITDSKAMSASAFRTGEAIKDFINYDEHYMLLSGVNHPILKAEYVKVVSVEYSVGTSIKMHPGDEINIGAHTVPNHATASNVILSSESSVCAINGDSIKIGENAPVGTSLSIFGEADGVIGELKIEVIKIDVAAIKIKSEDDASTIVPGGCMKFNTEIFPSNSSIQDVKYDTTSPFAEIDIYGNLTVSLDAPIGLEFTVTAVAYDNISLMDEYRVRVVAAQVKSVTVANETTAFKVTESLKLTGYAVIENAEIYDINYMIVAEMTTAANARIIGDVLFADGLGEIAIVPEYDGFVGDTVIFTVLPEPVKSISFLNGNRFAVNDSLTLLVSVNPSNATYDEIKFAIIGENNVGATFNGNILTAASVGQIQIQASVGGVSEIINIFIEESAESVEITDIQLINDKFIISQSLLLQAVLTPSEAISNVYFEIANDGGTAATIVNGALIAKIPGIITLKAYTANYEKTLFVEALKVNVERVTFNNAERFKITESLKLNAVALPVNATYPTPVYEIVSSSAEGVTIENDILVAKSVGEIVIRAQADGIYSDEFIIHADKEPVTEVRLISSKTSFKHTESLMLSALALPMQATYRDIEFFVSSDPLETRATDKDKNINARIIENVLTADCPGIVTIIMRCDGRDYKQTIVVEKEPVQKIVELRTIVYSKNLSETQFRTSGQLDLTAYVYPANSTYQDLKYEILNNNCGAALSDEYARSGESGLVYLTAKLPGVVIVRVSSVDNPAIFTDYEIEVLEEYVSDIYFGLKELSKNTAYDFHLCETIDSFDGAVYNNYDEVYLLGGQSLIFNVFSYASNKEVDPTYSEYRLVYYITESDFLAEENGKQFDESNPYFNIENIFVLSPIQIGQGEYGESRYKYGTIWIVAVTDHGSEGSVASAAVKITIYPNDIEDLELMEVNSLGILETTSANAEGYEVIVKSNQFEFTKQLIKGVDYIAGVQLWLKLYKYSISSYDVTVNLLYNKMKNDDGSIYYDYRYQVKCNFNGIQATPKAQMLPIISDETYAAILVYDLYRSAYKFDENMNFDYGVKYVYIYGDEEVKHTNLNFTFDNYKDDNGSGNNAGYPVEITLHNIKFKANDNRDAIRVNANGMLKLNVIGRVEVYGGDGANGANGDNGYQNTKTSTSRRINYSYNGSSADIEWNPFGNVNGSNGKDGGPAGPKGESGQDGEDGHNGGFAIRLQGGGDYINNSELIMFELAHDATLMLVGGKGGDGGNGGNGDNGIGGIKGGDGGNGGTKYCVVYDEGGKGGNGGNGGDGADGGDAGAGGNAGRGGLGINAILPNNVICKNGEDGKIGIAGDPGKGGSKGGKGYGGKGGQGFYMIILVPVFYTGASGANGTSDGKDGKDGAAAESGTLKALSNNVDAYSGDII